MFWPRDKVDKFKAKRQYFGGEGLEFFLFSNTWNFGFVFAFDIRLQEAKKTKQKNTTLLSYALY